MLFFFKKTCVFRKRAVPLQAILKVLENKTKQHMRHLYSYRRKLLALLLAMLFCVYYTDLRMCMHSHIVNNVYIVHSHFHAPTHHDSSDGAHTAGQLYFLDLFQTEFVLCLVAGLLVLLAVRPLLSRLQARDCTLPLLHSYRHTRWRAPPEYNNL